MTNHPNRSPRFALIVVDPRTEEGELLSRHVSLSAAGAAYQARGDMRWLYVAERLQDGSWGARRGVGDVTGAACDAANDF